MRIVESLAEIGGQCTALYPQKWIFDVPGHPRVLASELVEALREQALGQFDVPGAPGDHRDRRSTWDDELVTLHTDAASCARAP